MTAALALALALAAAAEAPPPPPPPPAPEAVPAVEQPLVTGVSIKAPYGMAPELYEPLVTVRAGDRLSRREVRRSLVLLFESDSFSDVSAFVREDGPGRVLVTFVLEPKRFVSRVELVGAGPLELDRLRRAAALRAGDEFTDDRLERAVTGIEEAYARIGFASPSVEANLDYEEEGVVVRFRVDRGAPTVLAAVQLVGDPGPAALARSALTLRPGDTLDYERLEADLERLRQRYREAGHFRAQVGQPVVAGGAGAGPATLQVPVRAGPEIRFRFDGHHAFGERRLRAALAYRGEELLDKAMVRELAERIERAYRRAGWYDAAVRTSERRSPDGARATLTFHVDEGRPLRVDRVVFDGNARMDDETLQAVVDEVLETALVEVRPVEPPSSAELDAAGVSGRTGVRPPAFADVPAVRVYDDELYRRVLDALELRYRDLGFLDVAVTGPRVEIDEARRTAVVTVHVREGPQTLVEAVGFPGVAREHLAPLVELVGLQEGQPLSERRLEEQRLAVRAWYAKLGHLYASVDARWERPPADPTRAVVRFHVREGPEVRAGRILVQGNRRTDDEVIRDALLFRSGDVLGSEQLADSQQRLMRLGLFRTAAIRPLDPDIPAPVKDLVVDVRERPIRAIEVGGGASIADGPRAFAEFTERNIAGRNLEFTARTKVNYQVFRDEVVAMPLDEGVERQVDLGLRYPRIYGFPLDVGARLDLIHERDIRPAYALTKFSGIAGLDWPATKVLATSLQFELESNRFTRSANVEDLYGDLSQTDLERLRFPEGQTLLGSVRPSVVLDLRDDPANPHAGGVLKATTDYAHHLGGDFIVNFLKLQGTATGYVPVGRRTTLAVSASGGKVLPLSSESLTIPPKRFYLGGATTLRGFPEDGVVPQDRRAALQQEISECGALVFDAGCTTAARFLQQGRDVPSEGGEIFLLLKGELRFPLYRDLMGGVFADAGNLWLDQTAFDPTRLRPTVGTGLRYATPVGPIALDLGVNLSPDALLNEDPFALHFSIGLF